MTVQGSAGQYGSAMRKRSPGTVIGVVGVLVASALLSGCSEPDAAAPARSVAPSPRSSSSGSPSPSGDPIGTVLRSVEIAPPNSSDGATADAHAFYAAAQVGDGGDVWSIERVDLASGAVTRRRLTLPFLSRLTVGPDGLYVMTSVIDKYGRKPDTLLRLDPTTLRTLAARTVDEGAIWDGSVHVAVAKSVLAEVDGGGSVRLLDPLTLATRASIRLLSTSVLQGGGDIESPAIVRGHLWVLAERSLIGLDLATLAVTSRTPLTSNYRQIVATSSGLELVGAGLARVTGSGAIEPQPSPAGGGGGSQFAVAIGADVLEEPEALPPALRLRSATGAVIRTGPLDAQTGLLLAASGSTAWIEGFPGASGDLSAVAING